MFVAFVGPNDDDRFVTDGELGKHAQLLRIADVHGWTRAAVLGSGTNHHGVARFGPGDPAHRDVARIEYVESYVAEDAARCDLHGLTETLAAI